MELQQMIELLLKEIRASQEKEDADRKAEKEEREANMKAWREEMTTMRDKWVNDNHDETLTCQEMEARQIERKPTSLDRKPEAAQKEEVPAEDATITPVGEQRKRRRDRKLTTERRSQKPKNLSRENCKPPPKKIGCRPQKDEPPCNSGTARGEEKRHKDVPSRATVA
ncbi:putative uncharacterized protein DDB_G0292636 [Cryptotermes secundus]|uniref:putative uncharacterized protein DDB_G0292636 n=1 Tax=Cryptotermes secundus TaxID=105785 RepID=UPI000CD7C9FA|nr:putative uncharacterized protein DDB_G0292636 [Cryptotermes secundus]